MVTIKTTLLSFCLFLLGWPLAAQETDSSRVSVRLVANVEAVAPGQTFMVGVLMKMAPGWHTYYREPGDSGLATSIQWELPKEFTAPVSELQWPEPMKESETGGFKVNVYKGEVLLSATVTAPSSISGSQVELGAMVKWLACKESCIPGKAKVALSLPVAHGGQGQVGKDAKLFAKPSSSPALAPAPSPAAGPSGFWRFLFFAFIGGLILNVMPCVLPVISLKVLGFLQHGSESPGRIRALGWVYALGVACSFLVLAGLVIATQRAGNLAGWGMQFQSPVFLVVITTLVTLVSLNLFGVFEVTVGSSTLTAASGLASKGGMAGAFFNGVFAVILATPCTAPWTVLDRPERMITPTTSTAPPIGGAR